MRVQLTQSVPCWYSDRFPRSTVLSLGPNLPAGMVLILGDKVRKRCQYRVRGWLRVRQQTVFLARFGDRRLFVPVSPKGKEPWREAPLPAVEK